MSTIKKYELFKVLPRWMFLKIETDDGLTGWGVTNRRRIL